jgi:2-amino-4-hydroxy-6-hydroxymethyldihydropteridine diphosphokinase
LQTPAKTWPKPLKCWRFASAPILAQSRLWRTPAYPEGSGPPFVNAAVSFAWTGDAPTLLKLLHDIEAAFGRRRDSRWEARKMDLDLIALDDTVLPDEAMFRRWHDLSPQQAATTTPDILILPHPRLSERGFVLGPAGGGRPRLAASRAGPDRARDAGGVAPGRPARHGTSRCASRDASVDTE